MQLNFIRLFFDFGLLVLIWTVQLVIYPSFENFAVENLLTWHANYVERITFIVLPLMLGQLSIAIVQLIKMRTFYTMGSFILILLVWILTFVVFVPLHGEISSTNFTTETIQELVSINWWRTLLWSLVFMWTLFRQRKPTDINTDTTWQ